MLDQANIVNDSGVNTNDIWCWTRGLCLLSAQSIASWLRQPGQLPVESTPQAGKGMRFFIHTVCPGHCQIAMDTVGAGSILSAYCPHNGRDILITEYGKLILKLPVNEAVATPNPYHQNALDGAIGEVVEG